ncbi:fasciclin [Christiangramia fulva]|uniref:Fasciclin n=2 Tax=Christiangramia fulva TaxID=2126553 RepID=A0A2R3Z6J6_9FLAO|nr:fasciclin [Christiangramia fulva]
MGMIFLFFAFTFTSCNDDEDTPMPEPETNTIVDFVNSNDDYSSLAAAIDAAGLTATLNGTTKYTVFAPNNAAFAAFLDANGFTSLDEVPTDLLTQLLLYHVQEGSIMAADLSTAYIPSLAVYGTSEAPLSLYVNTEGGVTLNGVSKVTTADVQVDNGVIHAVDAVIGLPDITTFALADPNFSILVSALTREDSYSFVSTLQSSNAPAPFTVFAPVDSAFVALLDELDLSSLDDIDADTLAAVLSYHVVTGANVRSSDLTDGMMVSTLNGDDFTVNLGDNVTITDANARTATVIAADVQATNGVIHALDTVILPSM